MLGMGRARSGATEEPEPGEAQAETVADGGKDDFGRIAIAPFLTAAEGLRRSSRDLSRTRWQSGA
jgi:hypothetical protein